MAKSIFTIMGDVLIDNKKAEVAMDKVYKSAQSLDAKLNKIWKGIGIGATAVAGGITAIAMKTAETADHFDKLSERTGIGVENLQRWSYAAGQSGVEIDSFANGIKKMSDVTTEAINGNKKSVEAFQQLGISMEDLKNKKPEDIFDLVTSKLADMEEGVQRNSLGNDLLGKSYTEMLPLLNAGSKGIQDLKNRADNLGLVLSEDAVKSGVQFGDTLDDLKQSAGALGFEIGTAVMPMLTDFMNWIIDEGIPKIKEIAGGIADWSSKNQWLYDILFMVGGFLVGMTVTVKAYILIMKAWAIATEVITFVTGILNGTLALSPLGWIAIAIGAVIAVGYLLIKNWDKIKETAGKVWDWIWDKIVWFGKKSGELFKGLANTYLAPYRMLIDGVNWVIEKINSTKIKAPDWLGGWELSFSLPKIPQIPQLAVGTNYVPKDMLAYIHEGEAVVPKKYNPAANGETQGSTIQLTITNFYNERKQDIEDLMEEIEFYTNKRRMV